VKYSSASPKKPGKSAVWLGLFYYACIEPHRLSLDRALPRIIVS
jgi:hypothetical protein